MRCFGALLILNLCLAAGTALAEPDVFKLGNGQHGALRVQQANITLNTATALTTAASEGSKALTVSGEGGFAAGELVLVLQVYAQGPAPETGAPGPIELDTSGAGHWEFARLESVAPGVLSLTAPLVSSFPAPGSQVVRVPEYTSVHVLPASSIVAPPWDGRSGGVLTFLVTGTVLNQGTISVDAAGFRGGTFAASPAGTTGCTEPHQSQAMGGAQKGEGISSTAPSAPTHGYAALSNAGGGGNCDDGGGGGGGHGGVGGQGGYTAATDGSRDVGGRGGLALSYSPLTGLMYGGGGGAGAGNSTGSGGQGGTDGGAGGGIIYIRARDFQGSQGIIRANGESAKESGNDGAGGGGAGGHVTIRVEDRLTCAGIAANGGAGGDNMGAKAHGPGGGGGGGVVLIQGQMISCPTSVASGLAGRAEGAPGGGSYGATPATEAQIENQGKVTSVTEPLALPAVPTWITPAEGETTGPRPQLQGTAQEGSKVRVFLQGQLAGNVVASSDGTFTFQPTVDLPLGPQEVRATAERLGLRSASSDPRAFTVGTLSPTALQVGCGCGAAQAAGGAWLALGVLWFKIRRRHGGRARRGG
jgi:MYXO-CTERM domain-containing protein